MFDGLVKDVHAVVDWLRDEFAKLAPEVTEDAESLAAQAKEKLTTVAQTAAADASQGLASAQPPATVPEVTAPEQDQVEDQATPSA